MRTTDARVGLRVKTALITEVVVRLFDSGTQSIIAVRPEYCVRFDRWIKLADGTKTDSRCICVLHDTIRFLDGAAKGTERPFYEMELEQDGTIIVCP